MPAFKISEVTSLHGGKVGKLLLRPPMLTPKGLDSVCEKAQNLSLGDGQPSWFRNRRGIVVRSELQ
jgi:hypothetical protein